MKFVALAACALVLGACAYKMKHEEQAAKAMPVNCATAEGDLRVLRAEKANLAQEIAMGVTAIVPIGLVIGLEAMRMLEAGVASAEDIDRAMELGYRHPMGPLRLTDLVGLLESRERLEALPR